VVRKIPLGFEASWSFVRWPDAGSAWHLAVFGEDDLRVLSLEDGREKAVVPGASRGSAAFLGGRVALDYGENRRQFLSIIDSAGRTRYEEVLEPGGALFAMGVDSFLLSECTRERCPTVWRYRIP
jgi:hypothetical protein